MPDLDLNPFVPSFPPLAAFGGAPLYVTGEDALACTVNNAAAGVTVTIAGRVLLFGATRPVPFQQTLTPATDRSSSVVRFQIGEGWLLNAQVTVTSGTPAIGQTFARLSIVHGLTSAAIDLFTVAADYVTAKLPLSYPGSPVARSVDGAGALRSITGATPGAGAEVSETVPTGARWELIAFKVVFATSATVANRFPRLLLDDAANVFCDVFSGGTFPASNNGAITWAQGIPLTGTFPTTNIDAPLPVNLRLGAGFRIRTTTGGIQVGDQYSAIQYLVREWIEGA